jgi:hypothetical protein
MSYRKIGDSDLFFNTMEARPYCEFFVYDGNVFYDNTPRQLGTRNTGSGPPTVTALSSGFISLYEYNIDRPNQGTNRTIPHSPSTYLAKKGTYKGEGKPIDFLDDRNRIYAFTSKDSARSSFKTVAPVTYNNEFQAGQVITFDYPLSASITREYTASSYTSTASYNSHYVAMRNRLNFYGVRSQHYLVDSPFGNKDGRAINIVSIPSIFYGSGIRPGTVSLKWYFTGSLAAELRDIRQNGELIQMSSTDNGVDGPQHSGSVAGVIMYDEGIILLTGSWGINNKPIRLVEALGAPISPKWILWGAGANDGLKQSSTGMDSSFVSASFGMSFQGTTVTQVMTMFAHAHRGQANYSNNPTYLKYGQERSLFTSSHVYQEDPTVLIANTVSSSLVNYTASFKRQVYISKIGVYDHNKNLIGLATLSNPILKKEDESYAFKLKMDI